MFLQYRFLSETAYKYLILDLTGCALANLYLYGCNYLFQIGKGEMLVEGKHVALLGYGVMVQNCLKAQSLLAGLGIQVTVASARFCKPLDIELIRRLCQEHEFLITVEEGTIGGFGSHVSQFMALDGLLDGRVKVFILLFPNLYPLCLYL